MTRPRRTGSVALIGAGPGDPGLITVRGLALLRGADVVVHDRLVSEQLLALVRPDARSIDVGKAPRRHKVSQEEINRILVREARAGWTVVRLKGGDPFVFGRGGEEAEALARAGIAFEVVPGITSAIAGPAAAGIPVTHRATAASVAIATAHEAKGKAASRLDWAALARVDTVTLLMGVERLGRVAERLIAEGKAPATPAAVITDATLPTQRTVTAPLAGIAAAARRAGIRPPAVIVVGDVVAVRDVIGGWDTRPLSGVSVLVTRTREQASELSGVLRELGAEVVESPSIRIRPPRSWSKVDRAITRLREGAYDWIVLTSANGVRLLGERLRAAGLDARAFGATKVAAVGVGTAAALRAVGIDADLVPATFTTRAVGEAFPAGEGRVLLARADVVEPGLDEALSGKGWTVERLTLYHLTGAGTMPAAVRRRVLAGDIDVITFASGGTVRAFVQALRGKPGRGTKIAAIGPVTAREARRAGLRVHAVADPHTIPALAAAVMQATGRMPASSESQAAGRAR